MNTTFTVAGGGTGHSQAWIVEKDNGAAGDMLEEMKVGSGITVELQCGSPFKFSETTYNPVSGGTVSDMAITDHHPRHSSDRYATTFTRQEVAVKGPLVTERAND